jgi:hypothetical protein
MPKKSNTNIVTCSDNKKPRFSQKSQNALVDLQALENGRANFGI